jgi:hypothetical protein
MASPLDGDTARTPPKGGALIEIYTEAEPTSVSGIIVFNPLFVDKYTAEMEKLYVIPVDSALADKASWNWDDFSLLLIHVVVTGEVVTAAFPKLMKFAEVHEACKIVAFNPVWMDAVRTILSVGLYVFL